MNRCDICGKFRKWGDLIEKRDSYMEKEREWLKCIYCHEDLGFTAPDYSHLKYENMK